MNSTCECLLGGVHLSYPLYLILLTYHSCHLHPPNTVVNQRFCDHVEEMLDVYIAAQTWSQKTSTIQFIANRVHWYSAQSGYPREMGFIWRLSALMWKSIRTVLSNVQFFTKYMTSLFSLVISLLESLLGLGLMQNNIVMLKLNWQRKVCNVWYFLVCVWSLWG